MKKREALEERIAETHDVLGLSNLSEENRTLLARFFCEGVFDHDKASWACGEPLYNIGPVFIAVAQGKLELNADVIKQKIKAIARAYDELDLEKAEMPMVNKILLGGIGFTLLSNTIGSAINSQLERQSSFNVQLWKPDSVKASLFVVDYRICDPSQKGIFFGFVNNRCIPCMHPFGLCFSPFSFCFFFCL